MAYDNELSGALFANKNKTKETQPGWKGTITIQGVEYWASGWVNKAQNSGDKYISLKFEPKDNQIGGKPAPTKSGDDFDDDIPF